MRAAASRHKLRSTTRERFSGVHHTIAMIVPTGGLVARYQFDPLQTATVKEFGEEIGGGRSSPESRASRTPSTTTTSRSGSRSTPPSRRCPCSARGDHRRDLAAAPPDVAGAHARRRRGGGRGARQARRGPQGDLHARARAPAEDRGQRAAGTLPRAAQQASYAHRALNHDARVGEGAEQAHPGGAAHAAHCCMTYWRYEGASMSCTRRARGRGCRPRWLAPPARGRPSWRRAAASMRRSLSGRKSGRPW